MTLRYVAIAAAFAAPTDPDTENQPFWSGQPDAPTFERAVDARLDRARDLLTRLVGVKGQRMPDSGTRRLGNRRPTGGRVSGTAVQLRGLASLAGGWTLSAGLS